MKKSTFIKYIAFFFIAALVTLIFAIFIDDLRDWWKWLDIPELCVCVCQEKVKWGNY
jgi:hypothetical protein